MNEIEKSKLERIINIVQNDNVSKKTIEQFLKLVLDTVKTLKSDLSNEFDLTSSENIRVIKETLDIISEKHSDMLSDFNLKNTEHTNYFKEIKDKIDNAVKYLDEVKKIKVIKAKDGVDGKDYILTEQDKEQIASLIDVPIVERVETIKEVEKEIEGSLIIDKINELPLEEDLKIDAKHIKNLPRQDVIGGGTKFLQYLQDVKITTPTNSQVLKYNSTTNLWENNTNTTVSFGTTTQLPYMNAGGTDFLYSSNLTFDGSLETVTANSLGVTPDNTKGLFLVNTTSAAAGAQQISPAIRWRGNGWKTSATAESRPIDFRSYVYTYQGSANPNGMWFLESSVNNASYNAVLGIGLAGDFYLRSGGSGSSGQVLQSGGAGIASSWLTLNSIATTGLTSGSGTTASGTAVNLGGTLTSHADINANDSYRVMISNIAANHGGISYASNEPIATWTIDGSWAIGRRLLDNSDHTVDYFDSVISVKTDTSLVTITFPDATTCPKRIITVKFYDNTAVNDIVASSGGGAIQSASDFSFGGSYSMTITGQRAISWQSNGTDWEIIWTQDNITILDSSEIDFTLTGQQITASIVASSIDEAKLDASVNASLDLADTSLQPGALTGYVNTSGTPVNNQLAIFTDADTVEGDSSLTYDGTSFNLATAKNFQIAGATILADAAGVTTLSNIDALDATTESTIETAIDTLANLTSIQGRVVTLADAGTNAIFGWDDVAGAYENLTAAEATATLNVFGADVGAGGVKGLVPATVAGDSAKYLKGDGTWSAIAGGGDMVLASAQTNSGVKTFLDTTMKLRNVANTFDGYFVNTNTADRIYNLQDAPGTLAFTSDITGTNSGTNTGDQSIFQTIAVSGQSNVVADSTTDTLTLVAGTNITITTDAGTDAITINATGGGGGISLGLAIATSMGYNGY